MMPVAAVKRDDVVYANLTSRPTNFPSSTGERMNDTPRNALRVDVAFAKFFLVLYTSEKAA